MTAEISNTLLNRRAALLRVFIGDHDKHHGRPLHELIVEAARREGLAGATVLAGFMGYGANSVVHHAGLFRFSEDLPIVIEIIDEETKVRAFVPQLETLIAGGGLITLEHVAVLLYQPDAAKSEAP